jgi:arsenite methyltransferase
VNRAQLDPWAAWLLSRRQGGAELPDETVRQWLETTRDRVLAGAYLHPDDVLLDVGCGAGLIGFGALELLPEGRVIFSDVSRDLLDRCRTIADGLGVTARCHFVEASADRLEPISDSSVDVVTTRSVLIYVADKASAFAEFHRVLRPAGYLSIFEPINRFTFPEPPGIFDGFDLLALSESIVAKLNAAFYAGASDLAPMMDFDERDLVAIAESAGFR